jgi:hypothetical protein
MATVNKDFRVKNGLVVTNGGTFGGTVTVATPTENLHAATKQYVDAAVSSPTVPTGISNPLNATNGDLFLNTNEQRLYYYYNSTWYSVAIVQDTLEIPQHIHDTAIDGTGLVVSTFKDAGLVTDPAGDPEDAGFYNTNTWIVTWDGGIAVDNFN